MYLEEGSLQLINLGRGMAWLDTGTQDALLEASNFVKTIQSRQGIMVACLEEIAYRNGWIDRNQIQDMIRTLSKTKYGEYLLELFRESERCRNIKK
ncbi:glucose-1-phosphate thymidylyltransferase [Fusobacterium necrophorum DAB]|nr:glucose-1-phosphate thymidylyltransferase [Fusobacterium necrophorum DAB]